MKTYYVKSFHMVDINGHWYVEFVDKNHPDATPVQMSEEEYKKSLYYHENKNWMYIGKVRKV